MKCLTIQTRVRGQPLRALIIQSNLRAMVKGGTLRSPPLPDRTIRGPPFARLLVLKWAVGDLTSSCKFSKALLEQELLIKKSAIKMQIITRET